MPSGITLNAATTVPFTLPAPPGGTQPETVFIGDDPMNLGLALQVAVAGWSASGAPSRETLAALHKHRLGKKAFPLVVVLSDGDRAWTFGPGSESAVHGPLSAGQATRLLQAALDEPDVLAARSRLSALQRAIQSTEMPGVANAGLFATYHLRRSVPRRADWEQHAGRARALLGLQGRPLLTALGFQVESVPGQSLLLTGTGAHPRAVAVLLEDDEQFDHTSRRFSVSPVAWGLQVAGRHEVPWLIAIRGTQIRLYPGRPGVGVSRKGQVETWFELDLALLDDDLAALLPLVFSSDALADGGTVAELLAGSAQYATALSERLRDRVYDDVVPVLATAVARQLPGLGVDLDSAGLDRAYRLTLRILFRLLFQAYAEDRELLPYTRNEHYRRNALKTVAADLAAHPDTVFDERSQTYWDDLQQVWRVIDNGDSAWEVPAYDGGLFGSDPALHPDGALLRRLDLDNKVMGTVLRALLVDRTEDDTIGAVDFRTVSVRDFGTIYEGLLESSLGVAKDDLTVDRKGTWVPAKRGDEVFAPAGAVYFHSASGERKATGSYFTPDIVVEHLLDRALEPVLARHLEGVAALLGEGDEAAAARLLFDFRVADLAMGSGHFLVAAVDRIERRMRDFLTEHPIPQVTNEILRLQQHVEDVLGADYAAELEIDPAAMLRRQVARRCIYGLDINPMAVELAQLALWISTFVPGLAMSNFDHGLVCADSLTGVGTVDEAVHELDPDARSAQGGLLTATITDALADAKVKLDEAAAASEADKAGVRAAAELVRGARTAAEPARRLLDAVVAARLGLVDPRTHLDATSLADAAAAAAGDQVATVRPAHMPFLFPEVFLRDDPGFDVLIGNPPWEKLKVEEHSWWGLRFPGLRSMAQKAKNAELDRLKQDRPDLLAEYDADVEQSLAARRIVGAGPYPGLGKGDLDLYQAFAWRNWQLLRDSGRLGLVLPRGALSGSALAGWRNAILDSGYFPDVCFITNNRQWLFPDVHPQYTVGLTTVGRGDGDEVSFTGPFASQREFVEGRDHLTTTTEDDFRTWSNSTAFPLLPDAASISVFVRMRNQPSLAQLHGDWHFRPFAELHTSQNKAFYDFNLDSPAPGHRWPVTTGRSFHLWDPDFGTPYAWADPDVVIPFLQRRRLSSARRQDTPFVGLAARGLNDSSTLACHRARIAFRDVTRATDTRTMICALIPPNRFLVEKALFLIRQKGDEAAEAFLLGILSSVPFDWYSRRFVELKMSYGLLNAMPVPRPDPEHPLRRRVVEVAGRLAAVDDRYSDWAAAVGVPIGSVRTASEKDDLIAELDALSALLYGLDEHQLTHVFATFHRGWDHSRRLEAVLAHYDRWKDHA